MIPIPIYIFIYNQHDQQSPQEADFFLKHHVTLFSIDKILFIFGGQDFLINLVTEEKKKGNRIKLKLYHYLIWSNSQFILPSTKIKLHTLNE